MNINKSKVFLRAIDVVDERGWGKGNEAMDANGPVCILGACRVALDELYPGWDKGFPDSSGRDYYKYMALGYVSIMSTLMEITGTFAYVWNDNLDGSPRQNRELVKQKLAEAADFVS